VTTGCNGSSLAARTRSCRWVRTGVLVTIEFEDEAAETDHPLEICAIDTGGQAFTGLVWLVEDGGIAAVPATLGFRMSHASRERTCAGIRTGDRGDLMCSDPSRWSTPCASPALSAGLLT
jgi:hypothetical protein